MLEKQVVPETYIGAQLHIGQDIGPNVRRTLTSVETAVTRASIPTAGAAPTREDCIAFWHAMSEWSNQNLAAFEGRGGGAIAQSTGAGKTAG